MRRFMPTTRPQDNVKISADSAVEEEHPLTNITEKCGMMSFFIPQNMTYFDKYNLGKGRSEEETREWKSIYHNLLQGISYYNGGQRQLLLKNPHNCGRIDMLLDLYPEAKFINIHRNPYDVYKSNLHLWKTTVSTQFLQDFHEEEMHERVMYLCGETLKRYFDQLELIPKENIIDVAYDDFVGSEVEILEKVYGQLNINGFEHAKPKFIEYLATLKEYKKNKFTVLPENVVEEINDKWSIAFERWGYEKRKVGAEV